MVGGNAKVLMYYAMLCPQTMSDMNKGKRVGLLIDRANILNEQMNHIFLKQGLTTMDLSLLPPLDKEKWLALFEESKKVTDEICKLINEK